MFKLKHVRKLEEIIRELPENIRGPIYEAFISFKEDVLLKETREIKDQISKVWEVIKELTEAQKRTEQEIEKIWNAIKELTEAQKRTEEAQRRAEEELASFRKTTEENFNKVWTAIRELAEAQKRTEKRVEELAEAQKRTEQRLNELAEAQKKTEQRVEELAQAQKETEQKIKELAEAQKKTEQRVEELAQAQKETEQKIKELAEAQKKTEESLKKLIEDHRRTREKLEGLSDSFGYLLEDRAIKSLPKILKENYNFDVVEKLRRDYIIINGEHVEVNIFGKVKRGDEEFILLGEAKSKVSKKAIDDFVKKCDKISKNFSKEVIKILVSYIFSPYIKDYANQKGIILIHSYELEL
jgi:chromosome segregation ATPase